MKHASAALRVWRLGVAIGLVLSIGCATTLVEPEPALAKKAASRRDLGIDHLAKGRIAMAVRELTWAESLDSRDPRTQLWLGEAYRRKGVLDEAESHILRALELQPDFQSARMSLSALYIQMERYAESIEHSRVLIVDPTFPTPWKALTNLGWAQFKQGRRIEARASLTRSLEYHPTYWPTLLDLGILEATEGHRLLALERFDQVLERHPGRDARAEVNYRMGELFVALGRRDRALSHFSTAAESAPHARWGQQSKRYLALLQ